METFEYPSNMVVKEDRAVGYFTSALKAGVVCIREMLNRQEYLDILGYDEIPVDMEAPGENQRYPYVHVMYRNKGISPISLDEDQYARYGETGQEREDNFSIYKFSGDFMINIYATTILERETIADCVIAAIAVDRRFRQSLIDNPYIGISPNMDTFDSTTSNESWGTPWSQDVMTAFRQCAFSVVGEFVWRHTTPVQFISNIDVQAAISSQALS